MRYGSIAQVFLEAGKEILGAKNKMWRLQEIAALLRGDNTGYLVANSFHFAKDMNDEGKRISHKQVWDILHKPDSFYCGNMTPMRFCLLSQGNTEIAILAVRESIREVLGIGPPRLSVRGLEQAYKQEIR